MVARQSVTPNEVNRAILDMLMVGAQVKIEKRLDEIAEEVKSGLLDELHTIEKRLQEVKNITVTSERGVVELEGKTHKQFDRLLSLVATKLPVLLVGPAGSGKTYAAEQVAKAFSLDFYAMSVGAQTSKSDIVGYMNANGVYVETAFRRAYEHGGVFLMDEIDAGNPNVLIILNSALSSNVCSFPDKMVPKHKDFYFVGTANTYGTGASRQYVGRNQIDAATLDRFVIFDWEVDEDLEAEMVKSLDHGKRWHVVVKAVRQHVAKEGYRVIVSPRATLKGAHLLNMLDLGTVIESVLLIGASDDQRKTLKQVAMNAWNRGA